MLQLQVALHHRHNTFHNPHVRLPTDVDEDEEKEEEETEALAGVPTPGVQKTGDAATPLAAAEGNGAT